ncbi:MAG TPA: hypothetical protein PLN27_03580 [Acidobacteriota bacterium]|nr:hypothetical protein [Acidobacteriota bacterium]
MGKSTVWITVYRAERTEVVGSEAYRQTTSTTPWPTNGSVCRVILMQTLSPGSYALISPRYFMTIWLRLRFACTVKSTDRKVAELM